MAAEPGCRSTQATECSKLSPSRGVAHSLVPQRWQDQEGRSGQGLWHDWWAEGLKAGQTQLLILSRHPFRQRGQV
jgi:hypothetical protein